MRWSIVDPARIAKTPWKNGGGVTRELLTWPVADDWRVRVSIADVERDGRFSSFPGVRRWFAVLEGEGVRLRIGSSTMCWMRSPRRWSSTAAHWWIAGWWAVPRETSI